ncbi:YheC/YheD family protein [Neobacillus massiliamazoniensis]|uniref:RimK-like ATP-grasp domain protein n=1 Tax=Neobacillus massiliamazoniensis TaxID=1499688 RepID=A0A0U1NST4_9BACI|nr:YheC/YheD family protein [Neobacillus massiliamazoniensis]CRK81104.1 RimK-like ATP-grasp domain protein [Neobacillus massiliamazoniensis]
MTLIGMLHHRTDPSNVKKAYAYAAVAKLEGVNFFYFTPGKVNIKQQKILGKAYENGQWIDKEFPFPDVIYNASYPVGDQAEQIVDYLFDRIPFTSHSIGDKISVYNRIKRAKEFKPYLIPFYKLTNVQIFYDMIKRYKKVIIKPITGHQGESVIFIEKDGVDHYKINDAGLVSSIYEKELLNLISHKILEQDYVVQQFISSQTKSGQVFDFRLHVQKNGEGKWVITSIYPRIGRLGTITSNMGSGGYSTYLEIFLKTEFGDSWYDIQRYLEQFAISFSNHFDSLYDIELDELGIDVGIDPNQKLWLFEVNWRPGPPNIFNVELDVAKNTILYAKYLAESNKH